MPREVWGLIGALVVFVFAAGRGRWPFVWRWRWPGFAVGFLLYVFGAGADLGPQGDHGWIFVATHVLLAYAGLGALVRDWPIWRRQRTDEAHDPEAAAGWLGEGQQLLQRFNAKDDLKALDAAVEHLQRAVRASEGHSSHLPHLAAMLTALHARYERLRHLDDLDLAIDRGRTVAEPGRHGGAQRARVLALLSTTLRLRYEHVGAAGDLVEAFAACGRAITLAPFRSRLFPFCNSEFAALLRSESERIGQPHFLDMAIKHVRDSLSSARRRGAPRPVDLATACAMLTDLGVRKESLPDLDEAVDAGRQALRRVRPGDRLFQQCQNNLGTALRARFELRDRMQPQNQYELQSLVDDLDEAIRLAHRATDAVPSDAPQRADHRLNLALALHRRYRHDHKEPDLALALEAAHEAANHELADVPTRIRAGIAWSDIAASTGRYAEAVTAFEGVIELLPRLAPRELRREDQEFRIGRWNGIAATAAACALAAGHQEKAPVLLEQGRGVLLARALEVRTDLTRLHAQRPELAKEFEELRLALDTTYAPSTMLDPDEQVPTDDDRARRIRRAQTERWDDLLKRIRAEDGFADFAKAPTPERILAQGAAGPVVYLNVSEHRSDAIILRSDGMTALRLRITPQKVAEQTRKLHLALRPECIIAPERQDAVYDMLAWLWDDVVEPVLDVAGIPAAPDSGAALPRVWWIPTGALTLLPIHAAGRGSDTLMDRAVSSYAPTVRALEAVRGRRAGGIPRPLVVAMSQTPGAEPLGNADAEAELVRGLFPDALLLRNHEATRERVLAEMRGHTWVHFACHGVVDRDIPSRGRLLLHDHEQQPLTMADISGLDLAEASLAYLSSCATARSGPRHADEAIHLASACQLAGFPDVIATFWRIPDRVAREFTSDAYAELTSSPAARAVHEATRSARAKYPNLPGLWSGYVHMGR
ncbi:MAG: CHAT domain-containing protein [Sciscionella sp.]